MSCPSAGSAGSPADGEDRAGLRILPAEAVEVVGPIARQNSKIALHHPGRETRGLSDIGALANAPPRFPRGRRVAHRCSVLGEHDSH